VVSGPLAEIRRQIQVQRTVRIGLMDRVEEAQAWLAAHPDVLQVEPVEPNGEGDLRVALRGEEEALPQLLGALMEAGFRVTMFREEKQDLEDIFLRLTKGIVS